VRASEDALSKCVSKVEEALALVNEEGQAANRSAVDAKPSTAKRALKALKQLRLTLDDAAIRQAEFESLEDDLVAVEGAAGDAGGEGPQDATAKEAAEQRRDEERRYLEDAYPKIIERADAAREGTSSAISAMVEVGLALVESFSMTQSREVRADEVKQVSSSAKSAFKSLGPSWAACRHAQEAWKKAIDVHYKAMKKYGATTAAYSEADAALAAGSKRECPEPTQTRDVKRQRSKPLEDE
jgi:hypothetical protein